MDRKEFTAIRRYLGKTQSQTAQLLGTSLKAIQSFEQGWRNVPVHIERQLLFMVAQKSSSKGKKLKCWTVKSCPKQSRADCPAWEFQLGHLCWFINGTVCGGEVQESWHKKMRACRKCNVFGSLMPDFLAPSGS